MTNYKKKISSATKVTDPRETKSLLPVLINSYSGKIKRISDSLNMTCLTTRTYQQLIAVENKSLDLQLMIVK